MSSRFSGLIKTIRLIFVCIVQLIIDKRVPRPKLKNNGISTKIQIRSGGAARI